jgi:hypothetical protein
MWFAPRVRRRHQLPKSEAEAAASASACTEVGAATMTCELPLLDSGMHLGKGLSKGGV